MAIVIHYATIEKTQTATAPKGAIPAKNLTARFEFFDLLDLFYPRGIEKGRVQKLRPWQHIGL